MKKSKNLTFHNKWNPMDKRMREAFYEMGERIEVSDNLKRQIECRIHEEAKKEERNMKRFSIKKVVIGVVASCLVVGTVCIAGSGIKGYVSGSSAIPDYTKFEDMEKAEKEVGYQVDAVDTFSNGYKLTGITIGEISVINEADQQEWKQKEIHVGYDKGNETISLGIRKLFPSENAEMVLGTASAVKTIQCEDITVVYNETTNKFVPVDYELTEEDKANMDKDNFNLAYGTDQVEINQSSDVSWIKDGIVYDLFSFDLTSSPDEMLNMAKEVIESRN